MDIQEKRVSPPEGAFVKTLWPQYKRPGRIGKTARATHGLRLKDSSVEIAWLPVTYTPENLSKGTTKDIARHAARKENWTPSFKFKTKSPENEHLSKFLHSGLH